VFYKPINFNLDFNSFISDSADWPLKFHYGIQLYYTSNIYPLATLEFPISLWHFRIDNNA